MVQFDPRQDHLFLSDYILVHWSGPWSEAPFTCVIMVQTKLKSRKVRTKQCRCKSTRHSRAGHATTSTCNCTVRPASHSDAPSPLYYWVQFSVLGQGIYFVAVRVWRISWPRSCWQRICVNGLSGAKRSQRDHYSWQAQSIVYQDLRLMWGGNLQEHKGCWMKSAKCVFLFLCISVRHGLSRVLN